MRIALIPRNDVPVHVWLGVPVAREVQLPRLVRPVERLGGTHHFAEVLSLHTRRELKGFSKVRLQENEGVPLVELMVANHEVRMIHLRDEMRVTALLRESHALADQASVHVAIVRSAHRPLECARRRECRQSVDRLGTLHLVGTKFGRPVVESVARS